MLTIGKRLKYLRIKSNFTQKELSQKIGLKQSTYSKYETDERTINTHILIQICKTYKVSADFILGLTNDPTPYKERLDLKKIIDSDIVLEYEDDEIDEKTKKILIDTIDYAFNMSKKINKED